MEKTQQYNIIVSNRARQMLGTHMRFLAITNALTTKTEILTAIHSLASMPERFPFFAPEYILPNKYHKMYIENWYLILYQIKDKTVYVDYILDCRQDYKW